MYHPLIKKEREIGRVDTFLKETIKVQHIINKEEEIGNAEPF